MIKIVYSNGGVLSDLNPSPHWQIFIDLQNNLNHVILLSTQFWGEI